MMSHSEIREKLVEKVRLCAVHGARDKKISYVDQSVMDEVNGGIFKWAVAGNHWVCLREGGYHFISEVALGSFSWARI